MKRYIYNQNNSGGSYDYPEWTGPEGIGGVFTEYPRYHDNLVPVDIWVMAESADEADELVQKYAGVYFDGCASGLDCECCGDRWWRAMDF
jgi:hypothetical protein